MIPEGALSNLVVGLTALVGEQEQRRIVERENYTRGTMLAQVVAALVSGQGQYFNLAPIEISDEKAQQRVRDRAQLIARQAFVIIDAVEHEAKARIVDRRRAQQPTAPGGEA
jgi:hypothetical protein